jgi:hypothetical protein
MSTPATPNPANPTPGKTAGKPPAETSFATKFPRLTYYVRLLKYFIISCVILTILEVGYAYWLISSRWHLFLDRTDMTRLTNEINASAQPVNAKFMEVYTKLFPNHVHTSLSEQVFINYGQRILLRHTDIDDKPHCFCDLVYDIQIVQNDQLAAIEWDGRLQDLEYGFGIEKFTTPELCFNYVTNFRIAELRAKLNETGRFKHLQKPLDEYTDEDFIEFIIMLKSKRKITRYRNLSKFEREMEAYKKKLAKARAEQSANP